METWNYNVFTYRILRNRDISIYLLGQGSNVSHSSGIVKLIALIQPANLLEDTQLI